MDLEDYFKRIYRKMTASFRRLQTRWIENETVNAQQLHRFIVDEAEQRPFMPSMPMYRQVNVAAAIPRFCRPIRQNCEPLKADMEVCTHSAPVALFSFHRAPLESFSWWLSKFQIGATPVVHEQVKG